MKAPIIYRNYLIFKVYEKFYDVYNQDRDFIASFRSLGSAKKAVDIEHLKINPCHENPDHKPVEIYEQIIAIVARKGKGHKCDRKCKEANHTYIHEFKKTGTRILGNRNGSLTIINERK